MGHTTPVKNEKILLTSYCEPCADTNAPGKAFTLSDSTININADEAYLLP